MPQWIHCGDLSTSSSGTVVRPQNVCVVFVFAWVSQKTAPETKITSQDFMGNCNPRMLWREKRSKMEKRGKINSRWCILTDKHTWLPEHQNFLRQDWHRDCILEHFVCKKKRNFAATFFLSLVSHGWKSALRELTHPYFEVVLLAFMAASGKPRSLPYSRMPLSFLELVALM